MKRKYIEFSLGGTRARLAEDGKVMLRRTDRFGNEFWRECEDGQETRNALIGLCESILRKTTEKGEYGEGTPPTAMGELAKGVRW